MWVSCARRWKDAGVWHLRVQKWNAKQQIHVWSLSGALGSAGPQHLSVSRKGVTRLAYTKSRASFQNCSEFYFSKLCKTRVSVVCCSSCHYLRVIFSLHGKICFFSGNIKPCRETKFLCREAELGFCCRCWQWFVSGVCLAAIWDHCMQISGHCQ